MRILCGGVMITSNQLNGSGVPNDSLGQTSRIHEDNSLDRIRSVVGSNLHVHEVCTHLH